MAIFTIRAKMTAQAARVAARARRPVLQRQAKRMAACVCVIAFVVFACKNMTRSWSSILLKSTCFALVFGGAFWIFFTVMNVLATGITFLIFAVWPRVFEMIFDEERYSKKGQRIKAFCSYDYVVDIAETPSDIIFILGEIPFAPNGTFYVFDKATLKGGTLEEFREFVKAKTGRGLRWMEEVKA